MVYSGMSVDDGAKVVQQVASTSTWKPGIVDTTVVVMVVVVGGGVGFGGFVGPSFTP